MKHVKLISAVLGVAALMGATAASAAPGYVTANVNMRTGPDLDFPSVEVIPEGTPVDVSGCLADESWCDVASGPNRGWVYSEYLGFERDKGYVLLPDVGIQTLHIPPVRFVADEYWTRNYIGRPWYAEKTKWVAFVPRQRPGWHPPPPGVRISGWWRKDYKAPEIGLTIPVEHWKHPHKH